MDRVPQNSFRPRPQPSAAPSLRLTRVAGIFSLLFPLMIFAGWPRPLQATEPSSSPNPTVVVTLEVNGVRKTVTSDHALTVVAGDRVKILTATLPDGSEPPKVNFVGFPNKNAAAPADDRGYAINTGKDLLKSWSVAKQGKTYRIDISSDSHKLATVPVRLIQPELLYVVAQINGQERVLRPGEVSAIKETDDFEIVKVVSNMADLQDPSVRFNMESRMVNDRKVYSMNFFRHDRPFGHIQLEIH